MSKKLFNSKEHYLAFRKAWAEAINDERAKKQKIFHKEYNSCEIREGWLTAAHMLLYNLLRDKPFYHGFTPVLKPSKLLGGTYINHGLFHNAFVMLDSYQRRARRSLEKLNKKQLKNKWWETSRETDKFMTERFLKPFAGTVTPDMLVSVQIPEIKPIYVIGSSFGMQLMLRIYNGEKLTFEDIYKE